MHFALPWPPSVNTYYRNVNGRMLISKRGREYRAEVAAELAVSGATQALGRLEVEIQLSMPDKRRRDLDNTLKALLDALQHGGAYEDDSQIDRLTVQRLPVDPPGRAMVFIRELDSQDEQWRTLV